jgi:23S rRNA pseudouridine1911/1915/1917 synthase
MLAQDRVRINGQVCRKPTFPVQQGDSIEISSRRDLPKFPSGLEILYEDAAILIVHKPSGLLTAATPDEREKTAHAYLRQYIREINPGKRLQIVHRLDKFASGILVFAKNETVRVRLKELFAAHDIQRKYWAIVEGKVRQDSGTIQSYLVEGKSFRVHSTEDRKRGKYSITHFRVLRRFSDVTAIEVTLETGRKNQIRVHLSEIGHPVVGDRAYGGAKDPLGRLGLHAFLLGFVHPTRNKTVEFTCDAPPEFLPYLPQQGKKPGR